MISEVKVKEGDKIEKGTVLIQYSKMVRGQEVVFTPGMAATAEIVTRQKSILTFLIEPITRRFNQAFSVR